MEDRHAREKQLWAEIKLQYEVRAQGHTAKINALKLSLDELRTKTNMGTEIIRTLLHMHMGKFEKMLIKELAKGWAGWAQQSAKLHTFRSDHENRTKEGQGFFKLSNELEIAQEDARPKPQEKPVVATLAPPVSEPTMEETPDSGPIPMPSTTDASTPLPTTLASPPQTEPCAAATREPPAQPELTSKLATTPIAEQTPELEPS